MLNWTKIRETYGDKLNHYTVDLYGQQYLHESMPTFNTTSNRWNSTGKMIPLGLTGVPPAQILMSAGSNVSPEQVLPSPVTNEPSTEPKSASADPAPAPATPEPTSTGLEILTRTDPHAYAKRMLSEQEGLIKQVYGVTNDTRPFSTITNPIEDTPALVKDTVIIPPNSSGGNSLDQKVQTLKMTQDTVQLVTPQQAVLGALLEAIEELDKATKQSQRVSDIQAKILRVKDLLSKF